LRTEINGIEKLNKKITKEVNELIRGYRDVQDENVIINETIAKIKEEHEIINKELDKEIAVVVFPTPPFWFAMAIILLMKLL
jgi:hypothetical protein